MQTTLDDLYNNQKEKALIDSVKCIRLHDYLLLYILVIGPLKSNEYELEFYLEFTVWPHKNEIEAIN